MALSWGDTLDLEDTGTAIKSSGLDDSTTNVFGGDSSTWGYGSGDYVRSDEDEDYNPGIEIGKSTSNSSSSGSSSGGLTSGRRTSSSRSGPTQSKATVFDDDDDDEGEFDFEYSPWDWSMAQDGAQDMFALGRRGLEEGLDRSLRGAKAASNQNVNLYNLYAGGDGGAFDVYGDALNNAYSTALKTAATTSQHENDELNLYNFKTALEASKTSA